MSVSYLFSAPHEHYARLQRSQMAMQNRQERGHIEQSNIMHLYKFMLCTHKYAYLIAYRKLNA